MGISGFGYLIKEGIINEVGGIKEAYDKLKQLVLKSRK